MIETSVFYLPSSGSRAQIERGLAGLDPQIYQQMLRELGEQARLADQLGYDSIAFTEHHFHVEGIELSTNPILLDLFVAMQTERIRVGQLGLVLPTHNPIRVAEDIAMLDHMSGGRAVAGFARGYQRRWVDTMAQQLHGIHGATPGQHDAIDAANRAAFEEHFRIIKRAWTEDLFDFQGDYWQIPPPGTPWDLEATQRYGAGVSDGIVQQIGVVPKPLQRPHPPIFQPFAASERTIRWCAREEVTAILAPLRPALEQELFQVYREEALACGRDLQPGQGLGVLRDVIVADTDEEAYALWRDSGAFVGAAWFEPFHFGDALVDPNTGQRPSVQEMLDTGLLLVGSPDTVSRQIEAMLAYLPVQRIVAWQYIGLVPHNKLMRSLELFATQVLPRFNEAG
ncbi:MAG: Flavin-dependent oxidoreductase, luciferase family [Chloroflexi bacterium]|nr:MAG: Flavin-dependent oxidoreductase, luciferase family [Chloroflexota bacterium]